MNKSFYFLLVFFLTLIDIYFFKESSDIRIIAILIVYAFFVKILKLKSRASFMFALIFLVLAYIHFIFSDPTYFANPGPNIPTSERLAVWTFLYMVVGFFQKWKE